MEDNNILIMDKESKEFLYKYLDTLNLHDCKVYFTLASNPCDSHLGVIAKAEIECKNAKFHWILKTAIQNEEYRLLLPISSIYYREIYAYEKILVEFARIQEEKQIQHPFKSYAKYLTSSFIPPNESIIMEDMTQWGYQIEDREQPLDYNHVKLVMREYGRFHALSFALRDQKPMLFEEISKNVKEIIFNYPAYLKGFMANVISTQIDRVMNALDPVQHHSAYQKCLKFKMHAIESIRSSVQASVAGNYGVVCHGDCWTNNILFKHSDLTETKNPSELCFIDWQLAQLGSPVLDLTTFLFLSTNKEFRDIYYDDVIQEYYNSFSAFLKELGSDPEELFPFSVLQEHLKTFSVFAFFRVIQALHLLLSDNENIPDFKDTDFNDLEFKENETYNTRMREIMLDFDRLGYEL
ncbi:hypothetical protein RN001_000520 [Aquatica leii]|uniref:CHK kinase-like domain-containing protein n=1 Tax=Aquatica leii TaxID=1421715 RepID=A0AAN7SKL9_9COLE|nr:hypothetical protein RN001_000520 [Aquatica leii]